MVVAGDVHVEGSCAEFTAPLDVVADPVGDGDFAGAFLLLFSELSQTNADGFPRG